MFIRSGQEEPIIYKDAHCDPVSFSKGKGKHIVVVPNHREQGGRVIQVSHINNNTHLLVKSLMLVVLTRSRAMVSLT